MEVIARAAPVTTGDDLANGEVVAQAADFETWYREQHPRLLAMMTVACGNREGARDITAEAFARALERWSRVRDMREPTGWVYTVAVNLLKRQSRRAAIENMLLRDGTHETVVEPPPDRASEVWDAVAALPLRTRTAVALRYLGGMTEREVAEAMHVTVGTVSASLSAARRRLAIELGPEDPKELPNG